MKLFSVVDYDARIKGYKEVNVKAASEGAVMPLLQSVMTFVYKKGLKTVDYKNGWNLPQYWSWS